MNTFVLFVLGIVVFYVLISATTLLVLSFHCDSLRKELLNYKRKITKEKLLKVMFSVKTLEQYEVFLNYKKLVENKYPDLIDSQIQLWTNFTKTSVTTWKRTNY